MDGFDLLVVKGTVKSLLQHHSWKASILRHSAFFTVQLSHPYVTTGETIALTRWTFVVKVMSLLFNMLSRLVRALQPNSGNDSNSTQEPWVECPHCAQSSGHANLCPLEDKSKEPWRLHLLLFTYLTQNHEVRNVSQYTSAGYRHFLYPLCTLSIEKQYNLRSNGLAVYWLCNVGQGKLFKVWEP